MSKDVRKLKDKAAALVTKGKLKKALKCYKDILAQVPDDLHTRQRLADTLAKLGDKDGAIREYQHVAGRYASDGLFLKAVAISKVILSLDPTRTETQEALALLYAREQQAEEAAARRRSLPASMSAAILTPTGPEPPQPSEESTLWEAAPVIERADSLPEVVVDDEDDDVEIIFDDVEVREAEIDADKLPKIPLFSDLNLAELAALLDRLALRWTSPGEVIVREGEAGTAMFVIIEGRFDVVREVEGEAARTVAEMGPGTFFGEMALVTRAPRLATITSAGEGLLLELDRRMLDELEKEHPKIRDVVDEYYRSRLIANLMRSSAVFVAFPAEATKTFVNGCKVRTLRAGTKILEQGGQDDGVYVILRGRCEVVHVAEDGTEMRYPDAREGDVLGEISTVQNRPVTATVRAATECVLLHVTPVTFVLLFRMYPGVREALNELVEERLQRTKLLVESFV